MDGYVTIGTNLNTSMVDKQIALLEDKLDGLLEEYAALEKATPFEGQEKELIKLGNEIDRTKNKLDKLKSSQGFDFKGIGKGLDNIVGKVGKWGLALFGVRSVYSFIRSSMNILASQNEELAAKIEGVKNMLAQSIAPIVETIVNYVYSLVGALGAVIKELSGRDIFAETSKSLKAGAKAAKEMKQQISGIDELNVLQKPQSGGGGGASGLPTNADYTKAVQNATKLAKRLKELYNTSRADFIASVNADNDVAVALFYTSLFDIGQGLTKWFAGLGKIIKGTLGVLTGLLTGDTEKLVQGINEIVNGWWEGFKGMLQTWLAHLESLGSLILGMIIGLFKYMATYVLTTFLTIGNFIYTLFGERINGVIQIFKGLLLFIKGDFKGGITSVFQGLKSILLAPINALIGAVNALIGGINKISFDIPDWVPVIGGNTWGFNIPLIPKLAKGGIVNLPGRGVPIGGAIAGERGMEGVIPLTDTAQMELLGQTIGKYVSLNATIPVYVGNRQIAREIRQINADEEFAGNH